MTENVSEFPPVAEHRETLEVVDAEMKHRMEQLKNLSPQEMAWVTQIRKAAQERLQTDQKFVEACIELGLPHFRRCIELGRETFGERWNDDYGALFMEELVREVVTHTCCKDCLLGAHPQKLHLAKEDP